MTKKKKQALSSTQIRIVCPPLHKYLKDCPVIRHVPLAQQLQEMFLMKPDHM